jgi:hypothetical protein
VRRVLRLDRVSKDRPRQPIRAVQVTVSKAAERRSAITIAFDPCTIVCQLDDLGRGVHDDMTNGAEETFSFPRTDLRNPSNLRYPKTMPSPGRQELPNRRDPRI